MLLPMLRAKRCLLFRLDQIHGDPNKNSAQISRGSGNNYAEWATSSPMKVPFWGFLLSLVNSDLYPDTRQVVGVVTPRSLIEGGGAFYGLFAVGFPLLHPKRGPVRCIVFRALPHRTPPGAQPHPPQRCRSCFGSMGAGFRQLEKRGTAMDELAKETSSLSTRPKGPFFVRGNAPDDARIPARVV